MKVLVVDDEELNLSLSVRFLEKMGFDLTTADNGKDAFESCKNQDFDLIFMDVRMPIMNGFEATKNIKKIKNIIIIAFTTYSINDILKDYEDAGFDGILQKPVSEKNFKEFFEKQYYLKVSKN
jgi:CheY-like chemotaxis protein